jgi:hypothetical protein
MKIRESEQQPRDVDWNLTTWEGAQREQMRRWAALPLERIILALEEMQELGNSLSSSDALPDPTWSRR